MPASGTAEPRLAPDQGAPPEEEPGQLVGIGAAALRAGVSERALRYYQELGLLTPSGCTPGGMRRYSEADLARVARIRELQALLGLNLDEIAAVLRNEDRSAELKALFLDEKTSAEERRAIATESLSMVQELRATVEAKQMALTAFLEDLDARLARIRAVLEDQGQGA
ncbi:MAG TPA: MerR family transcriptional regulator [Acidimicrobiales bacterium]|nr:MerR family transcriptional regulator [Acidimicrobiales bacterium]